MSVGMRIRELREQKGVSQGDIEKRTGLLRSYISRVENGHTIPSLETLERFASALEIPLYQVFYEGKGSPELPSPSKRKSNEEIILEGASEKTKRRAGKPLSEDARFVFGVLAKVFAKM